MCGDFMETKLMKPVDSCSQNSNVIHQLLKRISWAIVIFLYY